MHRVLMLAALLSCAGGAFTAAHAQKVAPLVTRDTDRDGVPDLRDRCRGTPAGTRVDATGCPGPQAGAPATQPTTAPAAAPTGAAPAAVVPSPRAPTPQVAARDSAPKPGTPPSGLPTPRVPVVAPGPTVAAPSTPPAGGAPAGPPANRPAVTPQTAVTSAPVTAQPGAPPAAQPGAQPAAQPTAQPGAPPAAQPGAQPAAQPTAQPGAPPAAPAPAVGDPSLTAGFSVPSYTGRTPAARLDYARMLALRLDSAVVALVGVFRGTTGQPLPGATDPNQLSTREKGRWARCRFIHLDLVTMSDAVQGMKDSMPGGVALGRAALNLAGAFEELAATAQCDNVGSMIEAPDRWAPWQTSYETSVRDFFRDWYTQLRAVHEADRAFARALNPVLPAGRQFPVPAGLPPTPPTIGGGR
jgi:hypothetical protein